MIEVSPKASFFSDNAAWLRPLTATILLLAAIVLYEQFRVMGSDTTNFPSIPQWVGIAVVIVGGGISGFYAFVTDTLAAKIFRWAVIVIASYMLLSAAIRYLLH